MYIYIYSLLHFYLVPVGITGQYWSPTLVDLSWFVCSLNLWLSFSMYVWLLSMSHVML